MATSEIMFTAETLFCYLHALH